MGIVVERLGMLAGEHWLFRDLSLDLPDGTCLALAGPNGSGKSTLLHCLYGVRHPTEGTVEVAARPPDERDPGFRREVAVLLDDSDFFAELSPRQHLELLLDSFPAGVINTGVINTEETGTEDVDHWLRRAGLDERGDVHAYHLSAGQRRRLLLLGAIARPHRVLLLDEPERALDAQGKKWLAEVVEDEREQGRTVVMATHHPPLVDIADQVVTLG